MLSLTSCKKNFYGLYDTPYLKDKSAYLSLTIRIDKTVEKTEIHTKRINSTGKWEEGNDTIICDMNSNNVGLTLSSLNLAKQARRFLVPDSTLITTQHYENCGEGNTTCHIPKSSATVLYYWNPLSIQI